MRDTSVYVMIKLYNPSMHAMPDQLLNIEDLAKRLKIPAKTIRNKLSDETWPIQPLRIGRALRWRESDVDRMLAELAAPARPRVTMRSAGRVSKRSVRSCPESAN